MSVLANPPCNFSWIEDGRLAAMGWPQTAANLQFLKDVGISHLITLSPEKVPPQQLYPEIIRTIIPVEEFEPPSLDQILLFIEICEKSFKENKAVGVHCRMGRGRTGVMAACYLVRFRGELPERAVTSLRLTRPGSVETYSQERAVVTYNDFLRANTT